MPFHFFKEKRVSLTATSMDMLIAHRVQSTAKGRRYGIQGYVWPNSDACSLFGVGMASGNDELLSTDSQTCWRVRRA